MNDQQQADLDLVLTCAAEVWAPVVVQDWLTGSNSYLGGARPIDVLRLHGPAEVLAALEAARAGVIG